MRNRRVFRDETYLSMTPNERAAWVQEQLDARYPSPAVPLDHRDPFTLLVAVLLSAQCTDARVNTVTPGLFALADTPEAMAQQPVEAILERVKTCGLGPQKAKAIRALSEQLVSEHGGQVPASLEALEALPGVGHKTASVVLVQAFGTPAFPVDTHIHRLAQRWGLTRGRNVAETERDLKRRFPEASWNRLHLQIIYFGREHCTARRRCDGSSAACPFCPTLNAGRVRPRTTRKA